MTVENLKIVLGLNSMRPETIFNMVKNGKSIDRLISTSPWLGPLKVHT